MSDVEQNTQTINARELAVTAARMAADTRCEDLVVLDLQKVSPVTDYFVIATGTSDRQIRSVADDIIRHAKSMGHRAYNVAGMDVGDWIVIDFVDVVVHLFDGEHRKYYDLELIWGEAPRVAWQRPGQETPADEDAPAGD